MQITTKEKFYAFVKSYPRKLERDVTAICEPPLLTYNDFTLGRWPKSMVAKCVLNEDYDPKVPNKYFIEPETTVRLAASPDPAPSVPPVPQGP